SFARQRDRASNHSGKHMRRPTSHEVSHWVPFGNLVRLYKSRCRVDCARCGSPSCTRNISDQQNRRSRKSEGTSTTSHQHYGWQGWTPSPFVLRADIAHELPHLLEYKM